MLQSYCFFTVIFYKCEAASSDLTQTENLNQLFIEVFILEIISNINIRPGLECIFFHLGSTGPPCRREAASSQQVGFLPV